MVVRICGVKVSLGGDLASVVMKESACSDYDRSCLYETLAVRKSLLDIEACSSIPGVQYGASDRFSACGWRGKLISSSIDLHSMEWRGTRG